MLNFSCSGGPGAVSIKSASGHHTLNLHFCIQCDPFLCVQVAKHHRRIFHARVGPLQVPQNARRDTLRRTCVFASSAIFGSHSAF
jgi:hypothetical protein